MKADKITVDVGLGVSDDDAAACVLLLQLYLKNHPDKYLEFTQNTDGETQINIRDKTFPWGCINNSEVQNEITE